MIGERIAERLPVSAVPGLPHIRLHLAGPQSGVWRLAQGDLPPYWAWCWPGGLALAHHIAAHPECVKGERVLDLGTGSGLVAIAAALAGAASVAACDADETAIVAAGLNAAINDVAITMAVDDPLDGPPPDVDLIMAGDLFYDADLARRVIAFLDRGAANGIACLIGDIGREHLPRERLEPVAAYPLRDFGETPSAPQRETWVYRFTSTG